MRISILTAAAAVFIGASAVHAATYTITDVGTLGGASSFGLDVNNNRRVSGNSNIAALESGATGSTLRAFSYAAGTIINLGALPGATTNRFARGYAVNDFGVVVGEFNNDSSRAFAGLPAVATLWINGVPTDLNTLIPAGSGWNLTSA